MPKSAISLVSPPFVPMEHAANGGQPLDQTESQRGASFGHLKSRTIKGSDLELSSTPKQNHQLFYRHSFPAFSYHHEKLQLLHINHCFMSHLSMKLPKSCVPPMVEIIWGLPGTSNSQLKIHLRFNDHFLCEDLVARHFMNGWISGSRQNWPPFPAEPRKKTSYFPL